MTPVDGPIQADMDPPDDGHSRLPCTEGPCRHAVEVIQVQGFVAGQERRRIYRFCRIAEEEFGTMRMDEIVVRACSAYSPPWWSVAGWRQRLRSAPVQMEAARRHNATPAPLLWMISKITERLED